MFKKIAILCLVMLISLITCLTAVSSNNNMIPALFQTEENLLKDYVEGLPDIEITLAHNDVADPTQLIQAMSLAFKESVETGSSGKISVTISPGGALGNTNELMEQTMTGEIQMTDVTEGSLAIIFPDIQVISIPYLFNSIEQANEVWRGSFGVEMFEEMRKATGLKVVNTYAGGFRNFTNSVRPIRTPEDMKGLKIRTMDIPAHMEIVRSLGAVATPIPWGEVYTSLQTGVVDGQENAIPSIIIGSLQEVQSYMVEDGHVYTQEFLIMNDAWFNGLPEIYQFIIMQGAERAGYIGDRAARVAEDKGIEVLSKNMEIYTPTMEEIAMFREATQDKVLEFIKGDIDNPEWIDKILEAAEEANKKLGYTN